MSLMERAYMEKMKKEIKDLEIELRALQKVLKYKSNPFCRRKLDVIIKNYFGDI